MVLRLNFAVVASLSFISTLCCAPAFAESNAKEQSLEEIIVVANRSEVPIRQVGSTVSVLTEEDLAIRQNSLLADTLRSVPGVQVSQSGGLGKTTSVRLRGEEAHRTLLLIDGINVADASSVQIAPHFEDLLSSQIGRVEILRGPQGMMYGADAGGVVSLSSKTSTKPFEADLALEGGSYKTHTQAGNIRGTTGALGYSLSASNLSNEGFNAREVDTENEKDGYQNTTLHGRFGFQLTEGTGVELVLRDVDAEAEFDGCGWPTSMDCLAESQSRAYRVAVHSTEEKYQQVVSLSKNTTERANIGLSDGSVSLDSRGEVSQLQYLGRYQFNNVLKFVFGADRKEEAFYNLLNEVEQERGNNGVFVDAQVSLTDSFFYTIGARHDDNEDFGRHTSLRLTGAYLLPVSHGELKLKGSYGTGFRAPSLYEINYNNGSYVAEDAPKSFVEEQSKGFDFGLEWQLAGESYIEAVLFSTTIEDEIYFDLANFCCYLQDEGETDSKGIELSGAWEQSEHLLLGANYTYNRTALSDSTTLSGAKGGGPRARRPKHIVNLSAQTFWLEKRLQLALFMRSISDSVDYPFGADSAKALDDYQVLDFSARWTFDSTAQAYIRASNVLDEDYQEVDGYNTAGASAYIGMRLSF